MQLLLLFILPAVFAAPQERFLLDSFKLPSLGINFGNALEMTELKLLTTQLFNTLGSDETEAACEKECNVLVHQDHILHYACPLVCNSFQQLVQHFNLAPTTATSAPSSPTKRNIVDSFSHFMHVDQLQTLVQQLYTNLGSDETEKACETECGVLIHQDHILRFACPLVCHSFQELLHHFNVAPATATPTKRNIVDSFSHFMHVDQLQTLVQQLYTTLGSDETEKACETECGVLIHQDHILRFACPLVCHSFQELVSHFKLAPPSPTSTQKRQTALEPLLHVLEGIFNGGELQKVVDDLYNTLGSDASEAQCELQCNSILRADGLLHHGCPLICRGFQSLVQHYGLHSSKPVTDPSVSGLIGKRNVFTDSLSHIFQQDELKLLVSGIQSALGADETEALCENECNVLVKQEHVLHYACPLICKSFQQLVSHFNLPTSAPAHPQRRFLISLQDIFGTAELKPLVESLYATLGSDSTEAQCETKCVQLTTTLPDHGSITQFGCPLVCRSFQSLLTTFDIHKITGTGTAVAPSNPVGTRR